MKKVLKIVGIVIAVILLIALILGGYGYYKLRNLKDTHDLQARVDKMCNKFVSKPNAAGLFVGIIQGDAMYVQGYGVMDKQTNAKPDSTTIFEIGSLTKVFTAEIAQRLVDNKELNWEDNFSEYLPATVKLPADDNTKLFHLASHTSGFPRLPEVWFDKLEIDTCDPYSSLDTNDLISYLNSYTDKKAPSLDRYDYSNLGTGILGHILEWRSGKSYEELLQQHICKPLGMINTSLTATDSTRFAAGYDALGNKTCHWTIPVLGAAGAIKSTGADMLKFLRANMGDSSELGTSMLKTQTELAGITGGGIAYGWHIDKVSGAVFGMEDIVWHNGATGGFRSYMGFERGSKKGIVVLSNQASENTDRLAIQLLIQTLTISLKN